MEQNYVTVTLCTHSGQVVQAAGPDHDDDSTSNVASFNFLQALVELVH